MLLEAVFLINYIIVKAVSPHRQGKVQFQLNPATPNRSQLFVPTYNHPQTQFNYLPNNNQMFHTNIVIPPNNQELRRTSSQLMKLNSQMSTQRLTIVKSPSTSFSPFSKELNKNKNHKVQNVRISLQPNTTVYSPLQPCNQFSSLVGKLENQTYLSQRQNQIPENKVSQRAVTKLSQENYKPSSILEKSFSHISTINKSRQTTPYNQSYEISSVTNGNKTNKSKCDMKQNENILNDTIDKLDFLEKKISNIMEKNDQLRFILKQQESNHRTIHKTQEKSIDKFSIQKSSFRDSVNTHCNMQSINQYLASQATLQTQVDRMDSGGRNQTSPKNYERQTSFYSKGSSNQPKAQSYKSQLASCSKSSKRIDKNSTQNSTDNLFNVFKQGRGKKVYPNGYMYEGEWLDGMRQGLGTYFNPLGIIIYQGEWKQDRFDGRGRLVNEKPKRISGEQLENLLTYQDGWKTYEGEFKEGQKCGLGVMNFGVFKYHGAFVDDYFHGNGSLISEDKTTPPLTGKWEEGIFIDN